MSDESSQYTLPFDPSPPLPSMPRYVGDWRKDPRIQTLDYEHRGVWNEIECLMWGSEYRGKLLLNGRPMPVEALAMALGLDVHRCSNMLDTLLARGPAKREQGTGIIYSDWMLANEEKRRAKARAGRLGGIASAQARREADEALMGEQDPTFSVSVSVSNKKDAHKSGDYSPEFERFWRMMPKRAGSNPKKAAWEAWSARKREGVSEQEMISAAERYAAYCQATGKAKTEFVLRGASFLGPKTEGWKEDWEIPEPEPTKRGSSGNADGAVLDEKFTKDWVPDIHERNVSGDGDGQGNVSKVAEQLLERAKKAAETHDPH